MFLMSYFKKADESMYLAVSEDGFRWEERNGGEPVLRSSVGTGQIRDPYVLQDADGRFHAIWTDGWESRYIGYAFSDDLREWRGQRLLPVMADINAVNSWAPEVFWDKAHGKYRIVWSSTVLAEGEEKKKDHRLWSALTRDFTELEPSSVFFDPGHSVIDACIVDAGDRYFMAYKDERGVNEKYGEYRAIRTCHFDQDGAHRPQLLDHSRLLTPVLSEGPTLYALGEGGTREWIMLYDLYRDGEYGALGSRDLVHWKERTSDVRFPSALRHASVIRLNRPPAK